MNLIALDLLEEELNEYEYKFRIGLTISDVERIELLKDAIIQLESLALKSDCITCRHNVKQEDLSELNDDDYLRAFDKCRTCANYYTNNFEAK